MNLWDMFKASKGIPVSDPMARLWGYQYQQKHGVSEISGVPPFAFTSRGEQLLDYRIYGNTVQDGTPSADAPVDATGCGVRTGNLLFVPTTGSTVAPIIVSCASNSSEFIINKDVTSNNVSTSVLCNIVLNAGTYTIKIQGLNSAGVNLDRIYLVDSNNIIIAQNITNNTSVQFTVAETTTIAKIAFVAAASSIYNNQVVSIMLNTGSTPLPYEPYGYKIPVTVSNGTSSVTTPVYIGSEPLHKIGDYADYVDFKRGVVVRRIKKLVLTGEESDWCAAGEGSAKLYNHTIRTGISYSSEALCNVAEYIDSVTTSSGAAFDIVAYQGSLVIRFHAIDYATLNDFKSYLAAQYAAGTPVTIWYVLAEPEEEPLENLLPIQTIKGTNILTVGTTVQPSEMYIKGKIKPIGGNENG